MCWYVDNLKASDSKVNDKFLKWLNLKYGDVAKVKATRGKHQHYWAIILIFPGDGTVVIDMCY